MYLPDYILTVINRLSEHGFEAYSVGGCVRDYLLGQCPKDYDVTTSALPEQIIECFSDYKLLLFGLKHGTVTVCIDNNFVEVTTFRVDGEYSDHRHPEAVTFTASLEQDLARRDFTINAMAYNPEKGLIDIFGGRQDIGKGIIRSVGNPYKRFDEDGLRILRALRFASRYGFTVEEQTAKAASELKHLLGNISAERIQCELIGILMGECYNVLHNHSDIVCEIIPEMTPCVGFEQHSKYHDRTIYEHIISTVAASEKDIIYRLTMLLHDIGKPDCFFTEDGVGHFYGHAAVSKAIAEKILKRLKFSRKICDEVLFLIENHGITMNNTEKYIKKALLRYGEEHFFSLIKIHIFDNMGKAAWCLTENDTFRAIADSARKYLDSSPALKIGDLAVNGRDLIKLGLSGEEIGRKLKLLLSAVVDNKCVNKKEELILYLEKELKKGN